MGGAEADGPGSGADKEILVDGAMEGAGIANLNIGSDMADSAF